MLVVAVVLHHNLGIDSLLVIHCILGELNLLYAWPAESYKIINLAPDRKSLETPEL